MEEVASEVKALIDKYKGPYYVDYVHDLPRPFQPYAISDRRTPSGLAQIASSIAVTQAYDRPYEGFPLEHLQRVLNVGDTTGSPPRSTVKIPAPVVRWCFQDPPPPPAPAPPPRPVPPFPPTYAAVAPPRGPMSTGTVQQKPKTEPPPAKAPPPQPPPPRPEPMKPAPLVLPSAPKVDTAALSGMRLVSALTRDEVFTIAQFISTKLKNKRPSNQWTRNPLHPELTPEFCKAEGFPEYHQVIKNPISWKTIGDKIKAMAYRTLYEFEDDVELLVRNATTFNPPGSEVHKFAMKQMKDFKAMLAKEKKDYMLQDDRPAAAAAVAEEKEGGGGEKGGEPDREEGGGGVEKSGGDEPVVTKAEGGEVVGKDGQGVEADMMDVASAWEEEANQGSRSVAIFHAGSANVSPSRAASRTGESSPTKGASGNVADNTGGPG